MLILLCTVVPRVFVVEREVEGPGKGWLSHDQIFQYNFRCNFSGTCPVTTSLCHGLCTPHASLQRGLGNEIAYYVTCYLMRHYFDI